MGIIQSVRSENLQSPATSLTKVKHYAIQCTPGNKVDVVKAMYTSVCMGRTLNFGNSSSSVAKIQLALKEKCIPSFAFEEAIGLATRN